MGYDVVGMIEIGREGNVELVVSIFKYDNR